MEILKLDIPDLEYIKRTIEWMIEHMDLKDQNQDIEDLHNLTRNSLTALERGMEGLKQEEKANKLLPLVSDSVCHAQCLGKVPYCSRHKKMFPKCEECNFWQTDC